MFNMNELLNADRVINVNSVFDRFSTEFPLHGFCLVCRFFLEKVPENGAEDKVFYACTVLQSIWADKAYKT